MRLDVAAEPYQVVFTKAYAYVSRTGLAQGHDDQPGVPR